MQAVPQDLLVRGILENYLTDIEALYVLRTCRNLANAVLVAGAKRTYRLKHVHEFAFPHQLDERLNRGKSTQQRKPSRPKTKDLPARASGLVIQHIRLKFTCSARTVSRLPRSVLSLGMESCGSPSLAVFPPNLTRLSLQYWTVSDLQQTVWPAMLRSLFLGHDLSWSDHSLTSIRFPPELTSLQLAGPCKAPLKGVALPCSLRTLAFGPSVSDPLLDFDSLGGVVELRFLRFEKLFGTVPLDKDIKRAIKARPRIRISGTQWNDVSKQWDTLWLRRTHTDSLMRWTSLPPTEYDDEDDV
jgi:hypothetical protein